MVEHTPLRLSALPHVRVEPRQGWASLDLKDLWEYRELLFFLTWRDIMVRYKQTALGVGWAILQPVMTMAVFSVIFGRFAGIPSDGHPYPVFAFAALLPWQLFSQSLVGSANSLVTNTNLLTKVYFPRLVIPLATILAGLVDFVLAFAVLLVLMLLYGVTVTPAMLALPLLVVFALLAAFSVGLWLSALNVKYRDVRYALPFLTQVWMFATPIAYSSSLVPEQYRLFYSLNPMVGVVDGFRWALLGTSQPFAGSVLVSAVVVAVLLVGGLIYFRRMEDSFADIV